MDAERMDRLLAELSPGELAAVPQYLHLFVRNGTMLPAEADEWRRRIAAWRAFAQDDLPVAWLM